MTGSDLRQLEALHRLLYLDTEGYAVLSFRRPDAPLARVERHAFNTSDESSWVEAVLSAGEMKLPVRCWPLVCGAKVLRGIGTSAHALQSGRYVRGWQRTLVLRWETAPETAIVETLVAGGGHLLASHADTHYGLIVFQAERPVGELIHIGDEVARELGALRWSSSLPVPGIAGARFVTDPALALRCSRTTGDQLVRAGLRPSTRRWSA